MEMSKPKAVICDLDGTLAIHDGRGPFEYQKCDTDLVNEPVRMILRAMMAEYSVDVLFVSGREDSCRQKTADWILAKTEILADGYLYMRRVGDYRKDAVVKEEIYRQQIEPNYDVLFVLDDRDQTVRAWRDLGLICFQVAPGNF